MEPAAVAPPVPCPLDSQRSMPGLILKLFVVNFVTLCFYFHCYHRREGRYLTLDAAVFFVAPLNTVLRYGVALLAIIGYACFGIVSSFRTNGHNHRQKALKRSSRAVSSLFGRNRSRDSHFYHPLDNAPSPPRTERIASRIGPVIPALGFITQCCGAIYLYNRRRQWNGATMIDQQIFQLACGGLLLGIISAGYTLRLPYFHEPIPDSRDTLLEQVVHVLRDQSDDEDLFRDEPAGVRRILYLLKSLAFAFIVQIIILRNRTFLDAYRDLVGPVWWLWVIVLGIVCGLATYSSSTTPAPPHGLAAWERAVRAATLFCSFLTYLLVTLVLAAGTVGAFGWHLSFYVRLGLEAAELKNKPLNGPCPLLMADPKAEYIWWLG
ncbi:hypothetical protein BJY01DRAFT_243338 [Aspergillus pseudoustus]|uniref:Uncharacterized protein n=1 Tax=Aspergillus pseudoustus TaxID=1810923 RepID=A0ABR4KSY5_9EURO